MVFSSGRASPGRCFVYLLLLSQHETERKAQPPTKLTTPL
ncbi:FIG00553401: hypothetical protein [Cronobacter sakazakii 680]|nr:FIG00553401: hypothetical protein [Cronobacter sakazakii 701]CCK05438.1 FIG00553401: hypothetical protein [Cronobacter sakazakii 696]CCK12438.1 FIG00553401: hypothetical protein [Cronobacter sakazakii 680]